jgi:type VI secretion system secreted protein VgrG
MPEIGASTKFTFQVDGLSASTWVARFEAFEAISELFEVELALSSEDKDIPLGDVVGKSALLTLETDQSEPRYIHGIVARFRHAEDGKKFTAYHATLVPKLWRLRHRHDSRIFQAMTVPDILKSVLGDASIDFKLSLTGSYSAREYCVQYRESDFAFISRLMEEEGIYYFFEHTDSGHTLVLADAPSAPQPIVAPDTIAYKGTLGAMAHGESVSRFSSAEEVRPGKVSLTDYNFKKPSLSLSASSSGKLDTDLEVYDYPGEYELPGDGSNYAKVRLEEWQSRRVVADGESGCIRVTPGYLFTLSDHPRDSENRTYLLTRIRHRGSQPQMAEAGGSEAPSYNNAFQAIPSDVPYRPERRTPRPTIKGVQTAIVTGPGGEEIHTDEHGRVKVQFHWDRKGKKDDKSSCWIRVSQLWAGAGWGAMWIPRIGHEVVVDFIEGDPDRPLIVGRVYHGANVPPYGLPGEKTKSTIKSNSSPGGGGSNELRFEDKAGQEEIYLHGQKDWNIKIEHDKNQLVGHDETKKVGHDETYEIGNDQSLQVDNDRKKLVKRDQSEEIDRDKSIHVGRDHTETIDNNETQTIGKNAKREVGADQAVSVGANSTLTVGSNHSMTVGGDVTIASGGDTTLAVGGSKTETVASGSSENVVAGKDTSIGKDLNVNVGQSYSLAVSKDLSEKVDNEASMNVGKKLTMTVGEGSVTIEKNGNITVVGKDITIKGSAKINVQGGSKVVVKSDGPVDVEASGSVKVKGSSIDLN